MAIRFTTCEQVKQRTVEQLVHEPQSRPETVEEVRVVPCERVQQQAVERVVDKSIPQIRGESVRVVEKVPSRADF